jgi:protein-tyrosine phosphatase
VVYERDLTSDLSDLQEAGISALILLVDDAELARWGDPQIVERAQAAGIEVTRVPIADGDAPSDADIDRVLDRLTEWRHTGSAAIACMGGVGRTGTVAACALVRVGMTAAAAIALVRRVRHPEAVETPRQQQFVAAYAARLGHRSG